MKLVAIVLGVFAGALFLGWFADQRARRTRAREKSGLLSKKNKLVVSIDGVDFVYSKHPLFLSIAPLIGAGQWDAARTELQRVAHGIKYAPEDEQRALKHIMMAFASKDPLYREAMRQIKPLVNLFPGIKQTKLYGCTPLTVEQCRYVLYFAKELGDVVRKRKGASYLIYPAGTVFPVGKDTEPEAKKPEARPE